MPFSFPVHFPISRQHKVRPVGNEHSPLPVNAFLLKVFQFLKECLGIDHHARTEDDCLVGIENAGGDEVQRVLLASQHNRVARIRPAGKTHDDLGVGSQKIDNFPFTFVSPLGSYNDDIHCVLLMLFLRGKYPIIHVRKDVMAFFKICQPFGLDGMGG